MERVKKKGGGGEGGLVYNQPWVVTCRGVTQSGKTYKESVLGKDKSRGSA